MANELDKTIEELEAEVLSELEEANGADAPMKSAGKPDKMDKAEGEVQDTGKAVVSPTQGDAPAKKIAAKAKEVGGDAQQNVMRTNLRAGSAHQAVNVWRGWTPWCGVPGLA